MTLHTLSTVFIIFTIAIHQGPDEKTLLTLRRYYRMHDILCIRIGVLKSCDTCQRTTAKQKLID